MPTLTIDQRNVHFEWLGKHNPRTAPTLVLISTEHRPASNYKPLFGPLAERANILCIDQTNTGLSARIGRALSTAELVEEMRLVLADQDVHRPLFFGYCPTVSLAATCASQIGGGAVLLSGLFAYRRQRWLDLFYQVMLRHIRNKDASALGELLLLTSGGSAFFEGSSLGLLVEKKDLSVLMQDPGYLYASMQARAAPWDPDLYRAIPGPIMLIKGVRDALNPEALLREAFAGIPHTLELIDAGHRVMDEALTVVLGLIEGLIDAHRTTSWGVFDGVPAH